MTSRSRKWVKSSFHITVPSSWRGRVVCADRCEECELFKRGCAVKCVRWDNLVCPDCPCLVSEAASEAASEPSCVDPYAEEIIDLPCKKVSKRIIP